MRAKIIQRRFDDGTGVILSTPPHLVDKEVELLEYEDSGYDTDRPTGYERRYFRVRLEDGTETDVDSAFVVKLDNTRLFWDDIKDLPRNFP